MKRFIICISISLLVLPVAIAQKSWKKIADFNNSNSLVDLDIGHNGRVFAMTADRWIYYSDDQGDNWTAFNTVHGFFNVDAMKASHTSSRLFVRTSLNGLAWTDDYAEWDWELFSPVNGFGDAIMGIGTHPTKSKTLVASINFKLNRLEMHHSSNNGNSWPITYVITFSPSDLFYFKDSLAFASSLNGLYFTNTPQTGVWNLIAFGGNEVTDLVSNGNGDLFASVNITMGGNGDVYHSSNNGASWNYVSPLPVPSSISNLAFDSINNLLYATTSSGVYMLSNGSWTKVDMNNFATQAVCNSDQSVLIGGPRLVGVKKKESSQNSFSTVAQGLLLPADLMAISSDDQLYYGSIYTPFMSRLDLNSKKWEIYHLLDTVETDRMLSMKGDKDGNVLAAGVGYIVKMSDSGKVMTSIASQGSAPNAPIYNKLFPQKLYAGNDGSISMIQHASQNYIDFSVDQGMTWDTLFKNGQNGIGAFNIKKVCSGTKTHYVQIFSSTTFADAIIFSVDSGLSWSATSPPSVQVKDIYMDRYDQLYAKGYKYLYKYDITNDQWDTLNIDLGSDPNMTADMVFDYNNRMYLVSRNNGPPVPEEGIYFSDDSGSTFTSIGYPTHNGNKLYIKTLDFTSDNIPTAITQNGSEKDFTRDGIYQYKEHPSTVGYDEVRDDKDVLIYPNPASNLINLIYDGIYSYKILDITGKTHITGYGTRGVETISVNQLPAGMYLLLVEDGYKVSTQPLIIK